MDKISLPRGLIRYSTENALTQHFGMRDIFQRLLRVRTMLYTAILLLIVAATIWSLSTRVPLKVDVIRDRSVLYREADDGRIENTFTLHIMNTDGQNHRYSIRAEGIDGLEMVTEQFVDVRAASNQNIPVVLAAEEGAAPKGANKIFFEIRAENSAKIVVREQSNFFMP